jgi:hypothetical protein
MASLACASIPSRCSIVPERLGPAERFEHLGHGIGHRPLAVEVQRELHVLGLLVGFGGRLARYGCSRGWDDLVEGEVLALVAAHCRSHRVDRLLCRAVGRVGRDLAAVGPVVVLGDEVDVDGVAGAGEGGVGPLVGEVLRPADHHRPLDRRALAAVPGQRVGVLEMLGDVVDRQLAHLAGVGLDGDRPCVEVDRADGAAGAVVDVERAVVAPRDHPVTHRRFEPANLDPFAQLALGVAPRACQVVECGAGLVVAHDHDRLLDSHLGHVGPPGGHGRPLGRVRAAVVHHQLPTRALERKPPIRLAAMQLRQRRSLHGITLPDPLPELVRTQPLRQDAEPAAGLDAGQLTRIAQRHHLDAIAISRG